MTRRCEAILVTTARAHVAGEQCSEPAESVHDGNDVCWMHARAAGNPNRPEPVRFIRQEAAVLRALGCEP